MTQLRCPPVKQPPARALRWSGSGSIEQADTDPANAVHAGPGSITLNSKTTALMMLDYVVDICATQPKCKSQMLPAMTPFMERVPKAGLVVAYGTRAQNMAHWLPQVAPAEGDIKIVNTAQDRFY